MTDHVSTKYAKAVRDGKVVACRWVKFACQRHLDDMDRDDIEFKPEFADYVLNDFFPQLRLWKGREYNGKEFVLAPHYQFITSMIFGWKNLDGTRRFRTAYIEMGRKGAKSTYAGGVGAYMFIADNEYGAEIYTAAVKQDQAKIVWENIKFLTKPTIFAPIIKYPTSLYVYNLSIEDTWSKCAALSSDSKSMDGYDMHFGCLDELHAHPTPKVYDLIVDSIGARSQPLVLIITTAGFDQTGICYSRREYLTKILKGLVQDDSFFGIIYTLDTKKDWPDLTSWKEHEAGKDGTPEDDWRDEKNWVKSMPGLCGKDEPGLPNSLDADGRPTGYMTKIEDVRDKCKVAKEIVSAQNNFLTKRMNVWTQQFSRWIDLELWDQNYTREIDETKLKGRRCTGGIDLSATKDLTVWVMLFPDDTDGRLLDVLMRVWCPKERLYDRDNKYADQYQAWEKEGFLFVTDGNVIDYDFVVRQVVSDYKMFNMHSIAVDYGFHGIGFCNDLINAIGDNTKAPKKVLPCRFGAITMGPLMVELERRLLENNLNHGGNPILRWMADNVAIYEDSSGNKKPDKATSQGKIDGIIGILFALDRLMRANIQPTGNDGSLI